MRRTIRSMFVLLLAILLTFSIAACSKEDEKPYTPESAAALWERIDQTMNALESVEMTRTTLVVYYEKGYQCQLSDSVYVLTTKDVHYTEQTNILNCAEHSTEQITKRMEAYYEGKMYLATSDGQYEQKFCSSMTHDQYDLTQIGELVDQINIADCTRGEFSKAEKKSWNLKFQGYTKKTIDKVLQTLGLSYDMLGAPIADMQVTLTANEAFLVEKMEIAFTFTPMEGQPMPGFSIVTEYSNHNAATFDPAKIKQEEYVEVDDIRVLDAIAAALNVRKDAPAGKFTLQINITENMQGQDRISKETDIVKYGRENGAYNYQIVADTDGQIFHVSYQTGEQTVVNGDQTYQVAQTEAEAKAYVDSLMDFAQYNPAVFTNIEKLENGSYLLTSERPDTSAYISGIEVISATQQITVTFAEGKLMQLESKITLSGNYNEQTVAMTVDSLVTFDDSPNPVE